MLVERQKMPKSKKPRLSTNSQGVCFSIAQAWQIPRYLIFVCRLNDQARWRQWSAAELPSGAACVVCLSQLKKAVFSSAPFISWSENLLAVFCITSCKRGIAYKWCKFFFPVCSALPDYHGSSTRYRRYLQFA